jgi:hypothetical protein
MECLAEATDRLTAAGYREGTCVVAFGPVVDAVDAEMVGRLGGSKR